MVVVSSPACEADSRRAKIEKLEDLISQVHADADQAKEILKALETPLQVS